MVHFIRSCSRNIHYSDIRTMQITYNNNVHNINKIQNKSLKIP